MNKIINVTVRMWVIVIFGLSTLYVNAQEKQEETQFYVSPGTNITGIEDIYINHFAKKKEEQAQTIKLEEPQNTLADIEEVAKRQKVVSTKRERITIHWNQVPMNQSLAGSFSNGTLAVSSSQNYQPLGKTIENIATNIIQVAKKSNLPQDSQNHSEQLLGKSNGLRAPPLA